MEVGMCRGQRWMGGGEGSGSGGREVGKEASRWRGEVGKEVKGGRWVGG